MLRFFADCVRPVTAIVLFIAASALTSTAQEISGDNHPDPAAKLVFRSWGTKEGLPQNTVNAIVQSRDGYLWLGTRDGLVRFDGVRFTVYGLQEGLPSVDVITLYEDRHGMLWIGTSGGGLGYFANGRVQTVTFPPHLAASGTVTSLAEDDQGRLWIGTRAGLTIWEHGRYTQNADLAQLDPAGIRALLHDRRGAMWIATLTQGLYEFRDNKLQESLVEPGKERIHAYCLLEDDGGNIWASIGNGTVLCRHEGDWLRYTQTNGLPFAYVSCLAKDETGTVWAGSLDDGLYCFDSGRFHSIRQQQGLSANDIRSLCPDREGNLWIGTRTGGLNRLSRFNLAIVGPAQGLTNDYTRSVAETPDGTLWVGTTGGGVYRGGTNGFEQVAPFYSTVESVIATRDGGVWWGGAHVLFREEPGGKSEGYTNLPWITAATVSALCADNQKGVWIGTTEAQLVHFQNEAFSEIPGQIARGAITGLAQDPAGPLWVGSVAGGLVRIDPATGKSESVTNGLPSTALRTLYLDSAGTLWIGTAGGGLCCLRQGKITTFSARDGLNANTVVQIVEDDFGYLWLGTSRGVFRILKSDLATAASGRPVSLHLRVFGMNEGMPAEECSSGFFPAGLKTRAGLICISTVKGLVFFDPRNQSTNSPAPNVLIEEVLANGVAQQFQPDPRATPPAGGEAFGKLLLPAGSRELEIHYTGINFACPEKLRFRYKLDGADSKWIEAGERRTAYYHHVPPGGLEFHVLACNADGVWSAAGPTLSIVVQPYLWERAWFRWLGGAVVLGLLAGLIRVIERRRYRRRLAQIEMRHAVERERLRISRDMHDDVGGILTQVSQLSDLGRSETDALPAAKGHFERIGSQARAAVQALDEIVWATNPKNDNLPRFIEYVCRFADEWFENSPIRCWQDVPAPLPKAPLRADVRHNIFLAFKEALNNVSKHSGATEVWLRLAVRGSQVSLSVEDNGRGFEPEKTGSRCNGLENIRARLAESGGHIELESAPGKGTKIRFVFPLRQAV